jgi:hypothetical protein
MASFTVFNTETGEILRSGSCPEWDVPLQADPENPNEGVLFTSANDLEHYVVNRRVVARPVLDLPATATLIADGIDTLVLLLPELVKITKRNEGDGASEEFISDGEPLEISTEVAGKFYLTFEKFPYKMQEIEIHATEPEG